MGFSNIFAAAMAFSVLLGIFYVLYESLPTEVVELDSELSGKYDDLSSRAATSFLVSNITHYSDNNLTQIVMENNGRATLDPDDISFLVDGYYIDETIHQVNRTINDDGLNPGLWDPGELLRCSLSYQLDTGTHTFKSFYTNGVWCSGSITIISTNVTWTVTQSDPVEGTIDAGADITGLGAGNDSDYIYLQINLSDSIAEGSVFSWYIDIDSNATTGISTKENRTLVKYPTNTTQVFASGAGIEVHVTYHAGIAKLYSQGDLENALEERDDPDFSHPSSNSLLVRIPLTSLGYGPGDDLTFYFYAYGADSMQRTDISPD